MEDSGATVFRNVPSAYKMYTIDQGEEFFRVYAPDIQNNKQGTRISGLIGFIDIGYQMKEFHERGLISLSFLARHILSISIELDIDMDIHEEDDSLTRFCSSVVDYMHSLPSSRDVLVALLDPVISKSMKQFCFDESKVMEYVQYIKNPH